MLLRLAVDLYLLFMWFGLLLLVVVVLIFDGISCLSFCFAITIIASIMMFVTLFMDVCPGGLISFHIVFCCSHYFSFLINIIFWVAFFCYKLNLVNNHYL